MNYDEARQIAPSADSLGGWHWTTMNDGVVRPAAPCRRYTGPVKTVAEMMREPVKGTDFTTCEPHATKEEAERHYYDYSLDQLKADKYSNWHDCAVCGAPTKLGLSNVGLALWFSSPITLCSEHLSREHVAELSPFEPGISSVHS